MTGPDYPAIEKAVFGLKIGQSVPVRMGFASGTVHVFPNCVWYLWHNPGCGKLGLEFVNTLLLMQWVRGSSLPDCGGKVIAVP